MFIRADLECLSPGRTQTAQGKSIAAFGSGTSPVPGARRDIAASRSSASCSSRGSTVSISVEDVRGAAAGTIIMVDMRR